MITKEALVNLYLVKNLSVPAIAKQLQCSDSKINYWLKKHGVKKRTISEAIYLHKNPAGNPFTEKVPLSNEDYFLLGLGMGLYWGEGNKNNKNSVRLGNSDPHLINSFLFYLEKLYGISRLQCSFSLQIFEGMDVRKTLEFWQTFLNVPDENFYKTMVKEKRGNGTYKRLVEYGVLTVHFNNTKLRNILVSHLEKMKKIDILTHVL